MGILALGTTRAEASHVKTTQGLSDVLLATVWSNGTITESEPFAYTTSLRRIDVDIQTLFAVLTPSMLGEELALGHPT